MLNHEASILEKGKLKMELKEAREGQFTLENVVYVLENEYATTDAKDPRSALATPQILGYGETGCIGILYYDPESKTATLGHIFEIQKTKEQAREVLDDLKQRARNFKGIKGYIIRPELSGELQKEVEGLQSELIKDGIISEPIVVINAQSIVFDTKTGEFYKKPEKLLLSGHPSERPYGKNRYDKKTGRPKWSKCYPENV